MKSRIDWLNHAIGFFVVLIGILLAFQLDKCHNSNQQEKLVREHWNAIIEESVFNLAVMEDAKDYSQNNLQKIDSLYGLIYGKADLNLINKKCIELLNLGQCYINKNAFNNLIQSGDIRYIKNFKHKTEVIALYEYYKWVEAMDKINLDSYIKNYQPYVMEHLNLSNNRPVSREIYEARKFLNSLGSYRYTVDLRIKKYNECITRIQEFLETHNRG